MINHNETKSRKPLREYTHGILENKRIQNFDVARTVAILCVVLCHSIEIAYNNIDYIYLSAQSQIFKIISFTIGRLGVPIFLLLTGSLILKKQIETDEDIFKFYKKNLLPLFITIEIWNILYNIFLGILTGNFSIKILIENLLLVKQVDMINMWYMPMILGMYLAIPFVAKIVKTFSINVIKIPIWITFISLILLPSANIFFKILNLEQYSIILDLNFLGGIYGIYILSGYYITVNKVLKKYNSLIIALIAVINFAITCIIQYYTYRIQERYDVWYNFITLFICGICIFELFTRIKNKDNRTHLKSFNEYISKISLGIFFMHEIFLQILGYYTHKLNIKKPIESIILFLVSFLLSVFFIFITSKAKIIKNKVFLIKD